MLGFGRLVYMFPMRSATIPGLILINAEWALRIVLNQDNPYMHDAFALTVCHEITHQEKDYYYFDLLSVDGKFVNWVDEVYADFGGVQKGLEADRSRAAFAMEYKLSCKRKSEWKWQKRKNWLERCCLCGWCTCIFKRGGAKRYKIVSYQQFLRLGLLGRLLNTLEEYINKYNKTVKIKRQPLFCWLECDCLLIFTVKCLT